MHEKLHAELDIFYKQLENLIKKFAQESHAITSDKRLSEHGKGERLKELQNTHNGAIKKLHDAFQADFGKRISNIESRLNGTSRNTDIERITRKVESGDFLSNDEMARLMVHGLNENKRAAEKGNFQALFFNADPDQTQKTMQRLIASKDTEKLAWMAEIADLKNNEVLSRSVNGQISAIRESELSPELQKLKEVGQAIQKQSKLFQYSIERAQKGDFIDVREKEND